MALWAIVALGCVTLESRLDDVTAAGQSTYLPAESESTRALAELGSRFGGGEQIPALVVFARRSGLTSADEALIARVRRRINAARLGGATCCSTPSW